MNITIKIKNKLINIACKSVVVFFLLAGRTIYSNLMGHMSKKAVISHHHKNTIFYTPNPLSLWRARTFLTKEPKTIEWIDSFEKDDVFWDVGANVGCYTLYAAKSGIRALAFEPSPSNYPILVKNLELNNLGDVASAFPIAVSDSTVISFLHMKTTEAAGAHSSFGESRDQYGKTYQAAYKHTMMGYSVDDFIDQFQQDGPNHIKIDVDGLEDKVIKGAMATLKSKAVKSVLIELNDIPNEFDRNVIDLMNDSGLVVSEKHDLGPGLANYIFKRQN